MPCPATKCISFARAVRPPIRGRWWWSLIHSIQHCDCAKIFAVHKNRAPLSAHLANVYLLLLLSHCRPRQLQKEMNGSCIWMAKGQGTLITLRQSTMLFVVVLGLSTELADSKVEIVSSPENWSWHMHQSWINSVQRHETITPIGKERSINYIRIFL